MTTTPSTPDDARDDREPSDDETREPAEQRPHRNPQHLAHDDPETEEDTASGGPA